jgi:hypothetical protein
MIDYDLILNRKYKGSEFTLVNNDYSKLNWLSNSEKPTKKALDDLWPTVQAEIAAEAQAKVAAKAAAQAKLAALGLTVEDLTALGL